MFGSGSATLITRVSEPNFFCWLGIWAPENFVKIVFGSNGFFLLFTQLVPVLIAVSYKARPPKKLLSGLRVSVADADL